MRKFGLSKKERIKSKKEFDLVYSEGSTLYSINNVLKARFFPELDSDKYGVKVGFAVHKKLGTAVWRNRLKRLLRTSYRLSKNPLVNLCYEKDILLLLIFSPNMICQESHKKVKLNDFKPECEYLIGKIMDSI